MLCNYQVKSKIAFCFLIQLAILSISRSVDFLIPTYWWFWSQNLDLRSQRTYTKEFQLRFQTKKRILDCTI